eukprot:3434872-Amphidinium_carterae.1
MVHQSGVLKEGDQRSHWNRRAAWTRQWEIWRAVDGPCFPLTVESVLAVAALFKAGGYRSWPNYVSVAKQTYVDREYSWSQEMEQVVRNCTRSVLRGLGPARQSTPLNLIM